MDCINVLHYNRIKLSLGINIFLDGFVPTENLRFREESLVFKVAESAAEEEVKRMNHYEYPAMSKCMGSFKMRVQKGEFSDSEVAPQWRVYVRILNRLM